ncbi:Uncharacterised protein [Vibrio cholerae]|nr:Uncharacterised protein [Vibrio cholerae]CSI43411.1 Uncharacterised protein [Vibrio cholerae]CSI55185.1 Uncharacterised protein [Vibrio cholerae]
MSIINGTPLSRASWSSLWISSSVNTLPVGLVGRDTQIAATDSSTFSSEKSTWYLNSP